jgi:molybdopterin converting factor small subunit
LRIDVLGSIRVVAGRESIDVEVPVEGAPLSWVLRRICEEEPRLATYLPYPSGDAPLRVVVNGAALLNGDDPTIVPQDSVLLLGAVTGG